MALELGITPIIIRDQELEKQGFGGIYGVGKAAVHPPALAVLSHTPQVVANLANYFVLLNFLTLVVIRVPPKQLLGLVKVLSMILVAFQSKERLVVCDVY